MYIDTFAFCFCCTNALMPVKKYFLHCLFSFFNDKLLPISFRLSNYTDGILLILSTHMHIYIYIYPSFINWWLFTSIFLFHMHLIYSVNWWTKTWRLYIYINFNKTMYSHNLNSLLIALHWIILFLKLHYLQKEHRKWKSTLCFTKNL